jgi:hypothetical protein
LELVAVKVLLTSYIRGLFIYAYPIYLNVFLYIVVYYRLVVYSLNNLISLYIARMPYYKGVIYKSKYLKS